MSDPQLLQLFIQGGAVGIALALIGLLYFVIKMMREIQREHRAALERNTDAFLANSVILEKLTFKIDGLSR